MDPSKERPQEESDGCLKAESTLSKNQLKRQRRYESKLKFRAEKRKLERERKKERLRTARQEGIELPPSRKKLKCTEKEPVDVSVVIDCSFEEYMSTADIKKLVKQIQHCYAINRRSPSPFKLYVTSYSGKVKEIMDGLSGACNWNITCCTKPYDEFFDQTKIVYLSSESENELATIEADNVYVIGGLVDHNSKKGLCHKLAVEKKISHGQLPISKFINMKSRKVLTIDHVFEILQKYYEKKDWEDAFYTVIPKRKGAQLKSTTCEGEITTVKVSEGEPEAVIVSEGEPAAVSPVT